MREKISHIEHKKLTPRRAGTILKEIEHRLRISLDSLLEGCQIIGFDWKYIYLNDTAAAHGKRNRDDLIGRSILEEYPGIEKTEAFALMKRTMEERTSHRIRTRFTFPDGSTGWFELSIQPVPEGIFILSINVTEALHREEALRESEERFRMLSENVGDLIALLDLEGRRLYNSPSYTNLLGDPETLRGTDSFREIHPDDREKVKKLFQETVRTGLGSRAEFRMLLPDGRMRYIESHGNAILDSAGKVSRVVVVSRDITERKLLEEQYLRSQRLESIGTLAGGIAHDLNNVLAPILAAIHTLRSASTSARGRSMLDTLETSAMRGAELVKQVLSFARGADPAPAVVRVDRIVAEIEKLVSMSFPKTITRRSSVSKNLWAVPGDPTQVHQVLLNLVVNAKDAMPEGGTLGIAAENLSVGKRNAAGYPGVADGSYVMLSVSDTGTGIPEEIRERIFDPFFTTKEPGKGTGLGLSTTKLIVKNHGGFITVESAPGRGATFRVFLPANPEELPKPLPVSGRHVPRGRGETILIVDDEAAIREITRTTLEAYGYSVLSAVNGAEAVAIYGSGRKLVDIVIADIAMPFMDGHAVIRELKRVDPTVRVLGVSGLVTKEDRERYTAEVGVRFLQKPFTAETLLTTLREMIETPRSAPPAPQP